MGVPHNPFQRLLDFVLAANCPLCQRSTARELCLDCQRQIQNCQLPRAAQLAQAPCRVFAWGNYSGALKRSLTSLKYDHHPELARPLAHWLADAWLSHSGPNSVPNHLVVVPIPIHPHKRQQRGFNQADLLAQHFSDHAGLPIALHGLARSRETIAQFNLSFQEREQNLVDAFCLGKSFLKQRPTVPVLLLDDIYTTGATARSVTQTLRQHGISVYGIAVVARSLRDY